MIAIECDFIAWRNLRAGTIIEFMVPYGFELTDNSEEGINEIILSIFLGMFFTLRRRCYQCIFIDEK